MEKFKNWIISHKLVSIIIASVLVVGVTLAIVLPLTLNKCNHEYDHACDTTCNICGETREIEYEEMKPLNISWETGHANYHVSKNIVSGQKSQQVFKFVSGGRAYEIFLDIMEEGASLESTDVASFWKVADYNIRAFDENFNELNILFEADDVDDPDCVMGYISILDTNDTPKNEDYKDKTVYLMLMLNKTGEDFRLRLQ